MNQQTFSLCLEKVGKRFKGIGIGGVAVAFLIASYYNVLFSYCNLFFAKSFTYPLPWAIEDPEKAGKYYDETYFYKEILNITSKVGELGGLNV